MKKILFLILFLIAALPCLAQTDNDAVYFEDDDEEPVEEADSTQTVIELRTAIDTIHTKDKYTDVILFDNQTWEYLTHPRPGIDSTSIYDGWWNTETLHAYIGYPKDSIPAEVDLLLVDETHGFKVPYQTTPVSNGAAVVPTPGSTCRLTPATAYGWPSTAWCACPAAAAPAATAT